MEVLEIEPVVPRLVVVDATVLRGTALELDRKDRGTADQGGVNSTAEPRNIELEVNGTVETGEGVLKYLDLLLPGVPLIAFKRKLVCGCEPPQNLVRRLGKEMPNRRPVVGGRAAGFT